MNVINCIDKINFVNSDRKVPSLLQFCWLSGMNGILSIKKHDVGMPVMVI